MIERSDLVAIAAGDSNEILKLLLNLLDAIWFMQINAGRCYEIEFDSGKFYKGQIKRSGFARFSREILNKRVSLISR